ncbi:hypothetical protein AJ87_39595 [Rhizobium yanglingense]|nr:hypothetical protein AJ87_39595 [Rhizobium yanglingense]
MCRRAKIIYGQTLGAGDRQKALALHLLADCLSPSGNHLGSFANPTVRRFLVSAAFLHLEEQAFALYIFFTARLACSTSL